MGAYAWGLEWLRLIGSTLQDVRYGSGGLYSCVYGLGSMIRYSPLEDRRPWSPAL
jgi:hypothetical protein